MTVDDIYFAAVQGEAERLEELLKAREVDLNDYIDCGINNGVKTEVPLLFSVLNSMSEKGFQYPILDLLVDYGADLDMQVKLSNDAYTLFIPLFVYALKNWKSLELMEYFLKRGANPGREQWEEYSDGHRERYPLIYFTIMFWEDASVLELLLRYGANPDQTVYAYAREQSAMQFLPPLFYALIQKRSQEMCTLLFQYGAYLNFEVDTGFGWPRKFSFQDYVHTFYRGSVNLLNRSFDEGTAAPKKPNKLVSQTHKKEKKAKSAPKEEKRTVAPKDPMEQLRSAATALIQYDFDNAEKYRRYVKFSSVQSGSIFTLKKRKQEAEEFSLKAQGIEEVRKKKVSSLKKWTKTYSEPVNAWWESFDGLGEIETIYGGYRPVWMPFQRIVERPEGLALAPMFTSDKILSGSSVLPFLKVAETRIFFQTPLAEEEEYRMAEWGCWYISDGSYVRTTHISQREMDSRLGDWNQKADDKERLWNSFCGQNGTNEDLFFFGNMEGNTYLTLQSLREEKFNEYADQVRRTEYRTVVDADLYWQFFTPLGILIFDSAGKIAAIAFYEKARKQERYSVDANKVIYDLKQEKEVLFSDSDKELLLKYLRYYPLPKMDPLSFPPEGTDGDTWVKILYAANCDDGVEGLQNLVRNSYLSAGKEKKEERY